MKIECASRISKADVKLETLSWIELARFHYR
jgi:hypothetical protein